MKLLNNKVAYRNLFLFLLALGVGTSVYIDQVSAYNRPQINNMLIGGTDTAVGWDQNCWSTMNNNYFGAGSPYRGQARASINNGGSYADATWVSAAGSGSTTTINVNAGTRQINLQLNAVTFLCSALVTNDNKGASYPYSNYSVVHYPDAPNDRAPNSNSGSVNWPARTDSRFRVDSTAIVGGTPGTTNLAPGSVLRNGSNSSTRYWFGTRSFTYTTNSPAGITSDGTITIRIRGRPMVQYNGSQEFCVVNGAGQNGFNYSGCPQTTSTFTINVRVNSSYTLTPSVTLNRTSGQPGETAGVTPRIANAGPTRSSSAYWTVSTMAFAPGAPVPNTVNIGDNGGVAAVNNLKPCQYYTSQGALGCRREPGTDGTGVFNVGNPAGYTGSNWGQKNLIISDYPVGTKVCYALSVYSRNQQLGTSQRWANSVPTCLVIAKEPKMQVLGGDLSVGKTFSGAPAPTVLKNVQTSSTIKNGRTFGSWVEYGIFATGSVVGAGSSSAYADTNGMAGAAPCTIGKLSFTNFNNDAGCTYVGRYSPSQTIPDVAASFPGTGTPVAGGVTPNLLPSGTYSGTNLTLNTSQLDPGKSIIIKASGTVTINGNQTYNPNNGGSGYTGIAQLPQLVIIANKIIIDGNVDTVDAWLIANGTSGVIETCNTGSTTYLLPSGPIDLRLTSNKCDKLLTVNGPVMAKQLWLRRTAGSGMTTDSGDPAEIFNLRPDAYLWAATRATGNGRVQTVYTTELPPRL